ncbi:hypothetical protein BDV3_003590 [Batrachochytrium dendrobatidis]
MTGGGSSSTLSQGLRIAVGYVKRSFAHIQNETKAALNFDIAFKKEQTLFRLNSVQDLEKWVVGSDADIGGLSEAYWGLTPQNTGLFWGTLSTELPPKATFNRSGYAGVRSKELQPIIFHKPKIDASMFRYLAIRAKGDKNQWFINLRTTSIYPTYVWQHRLYFQRPGEWETIMIPFRDFILTSHGFVQPHQIAMDRSAIKTVGLSILRQPGDFSVEIDWIKALNTDQTLGDMDIISVEMQERLKARRAVHNAKVAPSTANANIDDTSIKPLDGSGHQWQTAEDVSTQVTRDRIEQEQQVINIPDDKDTVSLKENKH